MLADTLPISNVNTGPGKVGDRPPKNPETLSTTTVMSVSLTARYLGCSPQGDGAILRHPTDLGIVSHLWKNLPRVTGPD